jgi:hypothetical protein
LLERTAFPSVPEETFMHSPTLWRRVVDTVGRLLGHFGRLSEVGQSDDETYLSRSVDAADLEWRQQSLARQSAGYARLRLTLMARARR